MKKQIAIYLIIFFSLISGAAMAGTISGKIIINDETNYIIRLHQDYGSQTPLVFSVPEVLPNSYKVTVGNYVINNGYANITFDTQLGQGARNWQNTPIIYYYLRDGNGALLVSPENLTVDNQSFIVKGVMQASNIIITIKKA